MGRFRHDQYIELTMHFRCNLKCEHCMIEGAMDWLAPESLSRLKQVIDYNLRERLWKGLILTGAEITLRRDLPELARLARHNGFDHVRIQTHGMRLADKDYCRELVDSGVDEFFVSVTPSDADSHDSITGIPGSFAKTLRGLENLEAFPGVVVLTNTVVTRRSYRHLPGIVDRLRDLRCLVQMEFWNYWPMTESDDKDLLVAHTEVLPFLRQALAKARQLGRDVEVNNFPECLLDEDCEALDNGQPRLLIDPVFWHEFRRNGFGQCVHRSTCASRQCLGLNTAYVRKYGWQADILVPFPLRSGAATTASAASAPDRLPLPVVGSPWTA